jgi:hypothetical protein
VLACGNEHFDGRIRKMYGQVARHRLLASRIADPAAPAVYSTLALGHLNRGSGNFVRATPAERNKNYSYKSTRDHQTRNTAYDTNKLGSHRKHRCRSAVSWYDIQLRYCNDLRLRWAKGTDRHHRRPVPTPIALSQQVMPPCVR